MPVQGTKMSTKMSSAVLRARRCFEELLASGGDVAPNEHASCVLAVARLLLPDFVYAHIQAIRTTTGLEGGEVSLDYARLKYATILTGQRKASVWNSSFQPLSGSMSVTESLDYSSSWCLHLKTADGSSDKVLREGVDVYALPAGLVEPGVPWMHAFVSRLAERGFNYAEARPGLGRRCEHRPA